MKGIRIRRRWVGGIAVMVLAACNAFNGASDLSTGETAGDEADASVLNADDVEVTPAAIDFGLTTCGVTKQPLSLTIKNKGSAPAPYNVVVPEGTPFAVVGSVQGTVPAMSSVALAILATPQAPGETSADLSVSFGSVAKTVTAKVTGSGPVVRFDPAAVALGDVRMQNGGSASVNLVNAGTEPLVVTGFKGEANGFTVDWPGKPAPLQIAPQQSTPLTVKLATGTMPTGPLTASLAPIVQGVRCGDIPALPTTGALVNLDVTISIADFDKQGCGTKSATTKSVVITNYSTSALTVAAALKNNSAFAFVAGSSANVAVGSSAMPTTGSIALKLLPVTATTGVITEDVTLTIAGLPAPSGGTRTTTARVDVRGATLTIAPTSIALTSHCNACTFSCFCAPDTKNFTVKNTGNEPLALQWVLNVPGPANIIRATPPALVAAGTTRTGNVTYAPPNPTSPAMGTLTPKASGSGPLCNTIPAIMLSGTAN